MKTTVEVPDDLYRRAKAEAALRGRKLKDLVEDGLRLVLDAPRETHRRQSLSALMKGARGAVDSGVPDLASNPEYLTGFGRDARVPSFGRLLMSAPLDPGDLPERDRAPLRDAGL